MVEKDYVDLGTKTPLDLFNKALSDKTQEYAKKCKPFDEPCARLDFRDKLEAAERESERIHGFIVPNLKIEIGDLDKYGDENRFELVEDQEAFKDKVMEGSRTQVIEGHTMSYKCKNRGHGISVFVSNEDYKKLKEKK
jgi:hypothetical protein